MRKQGYYRWLLSYLPIFFIMITMLTMIFFFSINSYSKRETAKANRVFAENVLQAMDSSLQFTEKVIIRTLLTDEKISLFYDRRRKPTPYENYEISRQISGLAVSYPLIYSIYLYRASDQTVLTPNALLALDQFGDRSYVERMMSRPASYAWSEERSYREFHSEDGKKSVVSLAKPIPLDSGSEGLVVVNILTHSLDEMFGSLAESDISFVKLLDAEGNLFLGTSYADARQLSSVKSSYTGWTVESGIKNKPGLVLFSAITNIWIIAGLLTVFAGTLWMVYVVRRNYKPIASINAKIQHYIVTKHNLLSHKADSDEFTFIDAAIEKLIEHSNSYEQKYKENLMFRKKWLFEEIIQGDCSLTEQEWQEETARLGLLEHVRQMTFMILEIDRYKNFCQEYSAKDQHLLKFILTNVIGEIAQKGTLQAWCEWVRYDQLGILCCMSKQDEHMSLYVQNFSEELLSWVEKHLNFTVSLGIGSTAVAATDISLSYQEAREALEYKSVLGTNRSIHYWEIDSLPHGRMFAHLHDVRLLAQHYRQGDPEWTKFLQRLFHELKKLLMPREDLVYLLNYVVYALQKEMTGLPAEIREVWEKETLPRLQERLHQFDVLDDIEAHIMLILQESFGKITSLREHRSQHHLIHQVKQYITAHYANPDLSLMHVSREFKMNLKSLSRIFKEEFNENFVDYVAKVRVEQAKELLRASPAASLHEVAQKVGYLYSISLIRVFKKVTGITPGAYRKTIE